MVERRNSRAFESSAHVYLLLALHSHYVFTFRRSRNFSDRPLSKQVLLPRLAGYRLRFMLVEMLCVSVRAHGLFGVRRARRDNFRVSH